MNFHGTFLQARHRSRPDRLRAPGRAFGWVLSLRRNVDFNRARRPERILGGSGLLRTRSAPAQLSSIMPPGNAWILALNACSNRVRISFI